MSDFFQIGTKCNTDKIWKHAYHRYYPQYIEKYKNYENFALIEIGVQEGFSLNLWLEYFTNAFIYGIDLNKESVGDRFEIFKADQSDLNQLVNVYNKIDKNKHVHFIIDDGSHVPEHQLLTFNYFFENILQPGGCYIIEDIETSYWTKQAIYGYPTNYGFNHNKSIIEKFKHVVDDINGIFLNDDNNIIQNNIQKDFNASVRKMISTVTFGENCIIIVKKTNEELNYNREYDFKNCL